MASGKTHDTVGYCLTPIVGIAGCYSLGVQTGCILAVSYFVGIQWLSPDLDTPSKPFHRWGILKGIWTPYQNLIPHRGISHWIVIGTLTRIAYLAIPFILLFGFTESLSTLKDYGLLVFVGLELSALTHLYLDGLLI